MIKSMTAFSRVQDSGSDTGFCWEIRAVNHRYLDVSFRMPEVWRYLEMPLRALVRNEISRGKIECQLKASDEGLSNQSIKLNEALLDALLQMTTTVAKTKNLQNDMGLSSFLNWPGVVHLSPPDPTTMDALAENISSLFKKALTDLQSARTQEGQSLKDHLQVRIRSLQEELGRAREAAETQVQLSKDKIMERLHALQLEADSTRLEQEIALMIIKMDVTEELDRLATHILEVQKVLVAQEPSGRRLDFLMQELHREANTLGSKSNSLLLSQSSLSMKVLIDQMREQIQNIE